MVLTTSSTVYFGVFGAYSSATATLINCVNKVDVKFSSSGGILYVGGLMGYSNKIKTSGNVFNFGNIEVDSTTTSTIYVGGIVAYVRSTGTASDLSVSDTWNSGDINVITSGGASVGGILGETYYCGIFTSVANTGSVNVESSSSANVGGIIGRVDPAAITYNSVLNTGDITSAYGYVGGIVGSNTSSNNMSYVINTGLVSGNATKGGLAGSANISSSYCYWIKFDTGAVNTNGGNTNNSDCVKTQDEITDASLYANYSDTYWVLDNTDTSVNYGAPYLKIVDVSKLPTTA